MPQLQSHGARLAHLYNKEIWQPSVLQDKSPRGRLYALLRIISITLTGLNETRVASRAAALSFNTLLSLGPLVAIAVLVAGFALDERDPNLVANKLNDLLRFVAPQIDQYEALERQSREKDTAGRPLEQTASPETPVAPPSDQPPPLKAALAVNPALVDLINNFISGARSSTAGALSIVSLIVIVLMLFTFIEGVFNDIWGVRRGRSWLTRLVFYWTILTFGALLFFGAVGALSWTTFIGFFDEHVWFGAELAKLMSVLLPALSLGLVVGILTLFYRYIPNTHVFWRSAFTGAVVVALLLMLNNMLAFYYFSRVNMTRNLYGSLGVLPILMFGLYIFWLFVLVGGQISYAVQNVHFRNSQAAWGNLTEASRERLSLIVLLTIARRFHGCQPPCAVSELGALVKIPTQILNECLNRLVDLKLITPVPPGPESPSSDFLYQPARPLSRITLGEFKRLFENYGDDPTGRTLQNLDPVIREYNEAIDSIEQQDLFSKSLDELFGSPAFARTGSANTAPTP